MSHNHPLSQRAPILLAMLTFAIALGVVIGSRLASTEAMAVALGVAVGVVVGMTVAAATAWLLLRRWMGGQVDVPPSGMTSIVLPTEHAERLLQMLNSRRQASPDLFPLTAARERDFTVVGGASLSDQDEPQP